jgi:hypothetical protein
VRRLNRRWPDANTDFRRVLAHQRSFQLSMEVFPPRIRVAMQMHYGNNQHLTAFHRVNDA